MKLKKNILVKTVLALSPFLISPSVSHAQYASKPKADDIKEEEKKTSTSKKGKDLSAILIFDGHGGQNGLKGMNFGAGYGPIAVLGSYSHGGNRTVNQQTVDLSAGRKGVGRTDELDSRSLGFAVEVHPIPYLFGGFGINRWNYRTRIEENIVSPTGTVLATNILSRDDSSISRKFYGGIQTPTKKGRFGLRVFVGHDSKMGVFGGAGLVIRLNKR